MTETKDTPSRKHSCPAWLRHWSPCPEHRQGSEQLIDNAILGWREDQKRNGASPRHGKPETFNRYNALVALRDIIRGCADCRCQTATIAAQAALEDAQKPSSIGPAALCDRFPFGAWRMMDDPTIARWAYAYGEKSKAA